MKKVILTTALILILTGCEAVNAVHTSGFDRAIFSAVWSWITSPDSTEETEEQ